MGQKMGWDNSNALLLFSVFSLLLAGTAHAGSSVTTLACSSVDGKMVISGVLPGQGEMDIALNVSVRSHMITYSNLGATSKTEANVELNAKKKDVSIEVKSPGSHFVLRSTRTKLKGSFLGTSGSFVGLVSGTDPETYKPLVAPVSVRCYVSDEI